MAKYLVCIVLVCWFSGYETASLAQSSEETTGDDRLLENFPIVPGTYWCGRGNISGSPDEVGHIASTDKCCRAHDMCPDSISAGKYKYGLYNSGFYTRSHCDCDTAFYNCLKESGNPLSIATGTTYFTVLGPKCFKKDYPITECIKKRLHRCIEYDQDKSAEPVYQWFDNPTFQ